MARSRQRSGGAPRGFDRTDRLNELLTRILAEELERIDDERLDLVTVMGVDTDRDLSQAKVYVTGGAVDDEVIEALEEQRSRLQRAIGGRAPPPRSPPPRPPPRPPHRPRPHHGRQPRQQWRPSTSARWS